MKKRVYVAYTGGTIGMVKTGAGYAPAPGYLQTRMAAMPEFQSPEMPEYVIHEYEELLDSSNMTPHDWHVIAKDIVEHYDDYDGFVVLHGTDTMAYTASALAFLLQGLRKPVILSGSQIPLIEVRNDARENLITVLLIAANYAIPEVCLYFGDKLLRGCRATKVNAVGFDAFASPNYPPLGNVGIHIKIKQRRLRALPTGSPGLTLSALREAHVSALRIFPGMPTEVLHNLLRPPLEGLVLETYGVGNGPAKNRDFMAAIKEASERGVVIVNCTQCLHGAVDQSGYATGSALAEVGLISGFDITPEAALVKLIYLIGQDYPPETVKTLMQTDLRGELTHAN